MSDTNAPFLPPWTPSSSNAGRATLVGGMEIYTDKSSLSIQLREPWFQDLKKQSEEKQWHTRREEMVAWYPVGGFVARTDLARPFGKGVIVLLARFTCRDAEGKQKVVEILRYVYVTMVLTLKLLYPRITITLCSFSWLTFISPRLVNFQSM